MKKFFKILMVFALLSGAALSCTKDYSKEIADVQKQNQELDGLIAALQNALNSTNTTVSQISAVTGKNEADIAALVSANAEAFAEIVASQAGDVEYLEELIAALEAAGVEQGEEIYAAIEALKAAQAQALATAIADLEGKIAAGDIAAAKVAADALAAAIEDLKKQIADGDDAAKKVAADALAAAVEDLKKQIADGDDAAKKAATDALAAAVEALEGKIAAGDKAAAQAAADALAAAVEKLEGQIAAGDEAAKKAAEDALAAAVEKLEKAIADGDKAAAKDAADALAAAVAKLEKAITDGDAATAKTAADALAAAVEALEGKIADGDKATAQAAADALAAAVETINKAIEEGNAATAKVAADLIAAVKSLEGKITAGDEAAKKAAADALAAAVAKLEKAITDGDAAVAKAAQEALDKAVAELDGKIDTEITKLQTALENEIKKLTEEDAKLAAAIAALATKTDASIAAINAALEKKADKSDVDAKYQALTGEITTLQAGLTNTKTELEKSIKDLEDTHNTDKAALEESLRKADEEITAAEARIKALEDMLSDYPEVKAQVATNKEDIAEIKNQVRDLKKTLDQTIADYKAADEEINKAIEILKKQVETLSARLTNISAVPARDIELVTVDFGTIQKARLTMDFKVSPASAAKVIADRFGNGVDAIYTFYIGSDRERLNLTTGVKAASDTNFVDVPVFSVVCKDADKGIITVSAAADAETVAKIRATLPEDEAPVIVDSVKTGSFVPTTRRALADYSLYVALTVTGKDEAGDFQRISDFVKPIMGGSAKVEPVWYYNGKAVKTTEEGDDFDDAVVDMKKANELKDTVIVVETVAHALGAPKYSRLFIVDSDVDFTKCPYTNEDVLSAYEIKLKYAGKDYSIADFKTAFDIEEDLTPNFIGIGGVTHEVITKTPFEWADVHTNSTAIRIDSTVFTASTDSATTIKVGFGINIPGKTIEEQSEFVGAAARVFTSNIALGKVDTTGLSAVYFKRIAKYCDNEPAIAEPLSAKFAIDYVTTANASALTTTFEAVKWISTSNVAAMQYPFISNEAGEKIEGADVTVESTPGFSSKYVNVYVANVPFTQKAQNLKIEWAKDVKINKSGVVAIEHGDYIDLKVGAAHGEVVVDANAGSFYRPLTQPTATIKTDRSVKSIFPDVPAWLQKTPATAADSAIVYTWYKNHCVVGQPGLYNRKFGSLTAEDYYTAQLWTKLDTLVMNMRWGNNFVDGKDYAFTVKDTIDGVIPFTYNVKFRAEKIAARVDVIPGFVQANTVHIAGASVNVGGTYEYVMPDINLDNYFKFVNLDKINSVDIPNLGVTFTADDDDVQFTAGKETTPGTSSVDGKEALLNDPLKINWNGCDTTSFNVKAFTKVNSVVIDSVEVKFYTDDPIVKYDNVLTRNYNFVPSAAQAIGLFKKASASTGVNPQPAYSGLTVFGIKSNKSLIATTSGSFLTNNAEDTPDYGFVDYPTVQADMSDWTCTVAGHPFDLSTLIDTCVYDTNLNDWVITTIPHDAEGKIVITIPWTWNYKFGVLKGKVTVVIN